MSPPHALPPPGQSVSFMHLTVPLSVVPRLPIALGRLPPPFMLLMRPTLLTDFSVNQRLPSGPAVIPAGSAFGDGIGYSDTPPVGVTRPIAFVTPGSVNQRLPSAPAAMLNGRPAEGIPNSVIVPVGAMRPMAMAAGAATETLPSGPPAMAHGSLLAVWV